MRRRSSSSGRDQGSAVAGTLQWRWHGDRCRPMVTDWVEFRDSADESGGVSRSTTRPKLTLCRILTMAGVCVLALPVAWQFGGRLSAESRGGAGACENVTIEAKMRTDASDDLAMR